MPLNHPETAPPSWSVVKFSSRKPAPGAKKIGMAALGNSKDKRGRVHM